MADFYELLEKRKKQYGINTPTIVQQLATQTAEPASDFERLLNQLKQKYETPTTPPITTTTPATTAPITTTNPTITGGVSYPDKFKGQRLVAFKPASPGNYVFSEADYHNMQSEYNNYINKIRELREKGEDSEDYALQFRQNSEDIVTRNTPFLDDEGYYVTI